MTPREAASILGLSECHVLNFCRRGSLRATHESLPGRSMHRLRWTIEAADVQQLAAVRAARPARLPVKKIKRPPPPPDPATIAGTLSVDEVAARLGVRGDTVYHLCKRGSLRQRTVTVPAWYSPKKVLRVEATSAEAHLTRRAAPRPVREKKPRQRKVRPPLPAPWKGTATLSIVEAAEKLSRAKPTVYTMCRTGALQTQWFLSSAYASKQKTVRVLVSSVEAMLAERDAPRREAWAQMQRPTKARSSKANTSRVTKAPPPAHEPPPGFVPLKIAVEAFRLSNSILLRLVRGKFIAGVIGGSWNTFIDLESLYRHQAATGDVAFWTPERLRRYRQANPPASREPREETVR